MEPFLIVLVSLSVLLSATAQILLKHGMVSSAVREALGNGDAVAAVVAIALSPAVLGGLTAFAASVLLWLYVLARVPLSTAYPFVALGIAITVAAGWLLFGEPLAWPKLLGVAFILAGILIVASA